MSAKAHNLRCADLGETDCTPDGHDSLESYAAALCRFLLRKESRFLLSLHPPECFVAGTYQRLPQDWRQCIDAKPPSYAELEDFPNCFMQECYPPSLREFVRQAASLYFRKPKHLPWRPV